VTAVVQRHFACREGDLAPGTSMVVEGSIPIALFRTEQGEGVAARRWLWLR
jgi:hypothetical protein